MLSVLITTSGTGERLGSLTKYTNKSLVGVGNKYAICYIIENYPITTEFIITLGYHGDIVRQFLTLAYPNHRFIFIEIDNFVAPGSSLGYSLLKTKNYLQKPFIFHCCDAVITCPVFDVNILTDLDVNYLCVYNSEDNLSYASVVIDKWGNTEKRGGDTDNKSLRNIKEINSKGHFAFDYIYTGISYIYNYSLFWEYLEMKYQENPLNGALSDVDAIRVMISEKKCVFKSILLDEGQWYDTGNMKSYQKIQDVFLSSYSILSKSNESLCFMDFRYDIDGEQIHDNRVIKFNYDKILNQKRIKRAEILGSNVPKILGSSCYFICMEKIEGIILSDYYVHGEIGRLLNWAIENLWNSRNTKPEYRDMCRRFYFDKTMDRIRCHSFLNSSERGGNGVVEYSVINGLKIPSIFSLMKSLESDPSSILCTDTFYSFHGDFILDNIMKTKESYVLIDWRHEFDKELCFGDIYYDLAKLRHNLFLNHKNINDGLFFIRFDEEVSVSGLGSVIVDMKCNCFLIQQLADYERFVLDNGFDMNKIRLITALIWLNMSSLYEGSFGSFLFYFGKYHLYLSLLDMGIVVSG